MIFSQIGDNSSTHQPIVTLLYVPPQIISTSQVSLASDAFMLYKNKLVS